MSEPTKERVREFWNAAACGEALLRGEDDLRRFEHQARERYELEPYIAGFAHFEEGRGKDVLEIGVGLGADHREWARHQPRRLCGIDLTPRAIEMTRERFELLGLRSDLQVADAEHLPFDDETFDIVYSYGVLHHTPDTPRAIREVHRVLRPNGVARIMIYHSPSIVGWMLWGRYALLAGKPSLPLARVYAEHLESPGTKAYSVPDARRLFGDFAEVRTRVQLSHGDLLEGPVGQRHNARLVRAAKAIWPRRLIRRTLPNLGTALLVEARR
jgi:SAM-dependent methyltransferase